MNIALNIALPHKIENDNKNNSLEFIRIPVDKNTLYQIPKKVIEIIKQINTNNNETNNF